MSDDRRRTLWDLVHSGRWILLVISAIAVVAVASYLGYIDIAAVVDSLSGLWDLYYPLLAAPVIGFVAGWYRATHIYVPPSKLLVWPRLNGSRVDLLEVPDLRFSMLTPTGNTFVLHSGLGRDVYLIKAIDIENNYVEWGDVHEHDPLQVATYIQAYYEFKDDLKTTKMKFLRIMNYPEVIAAGLSEKQIKAVLDALLRELRGPVLQSASKDELEAKPDE